MFDTPRQQLRNLLRKPFVWRARLRDIAAAKKGQHPLAICAIFREEAPFLAEWIEFHRGVGAAHFYLYNNFSTDDFTAVLAPYIHDGVVTLVDWPVAVGQLSAYRHCIRRNWRKARWIAFIDIDEFLFSPLRTDIRPILEDYGAFPGIHVWQAFFGAAGYLERPTGSLVEALTLRAPLSQTTVKTIVNPRHVYKPGIHLWKFWSGDSVDTSGRPHEVGQIPVLDVLRINHYWSRSLADLDQKVRRGDASIATPRDRQWHFRFEETLNAERDESILPVSKAIREKALVSGSKRADQALR